VGFLSQKENFAALTAKKNLGKDLLKSAGRVVKSCEKKFFRGLQFECTGRQVALPLGGKWR
jgi:hypothetical protein